MNKKLLIVALLFSVNNVFADNKSYDVKSGIIEYAIVAEKAASSKDYIKGSSKLYFKNFGATEIVDSTMYVNFNDAIIDNFIDNTILEEVLYTITLSINDNYDISEVFFQVNGQEITKTTIKTLE